MKTSLTVVMLGAVLATSGCMDETTTVFLNEDGSGSIVVTTYLSGMAAGMMGVMGAGEGDAQENANPLVDEKEAREKAATFGPAVAFQSVQEVENSTGTTGATAVYTFEDISKVKLPMEAEAQMGGGAHGVEVVSSAPQPERASITFSYAPGNLTIHMPRPKEPSQLIAFEAASGFEDEEKAQLMRNLFPMLQGMRQRLLVKLPYEIKKTNATYVEADAATGKRQMVTLVDVTLDALLATPGGLQKLEAIQQQQDLAAQIEMLKGIEGIKIQDGARIEITFQ